MQTQWPLYVILAIVSVAPLAAQKTPEYTKDDELVFPADYREWVFVSSGIGMTYGDGAPNANPPFENVFVNRDAYKSYLKTGTWPDKTVMILEIRASDSRVNINKNGRVQTPRVAAMEAHVKDSKKGGWAFYSFADGSKTGKPFPKTADCFTCHQQNGAVDTTFVQFYPTLIEIAKKQGTYKETSH